MSTHAQKVAVVTGGSRGIGAGIVDAYRELGYAVVAISRSIDSGDEPGLLTVVGDITDPATAELAFAEAVEHFGRVDTVVNNAGLFLAKPFTDCTAGDYAAMVGVNLAGFFL